MTKLSAPPKPDIETPATTVETARRNPSINGLQQGESLRTAAVRRSGSSQARLRVLHVLRAMNRGGIETWLMHALRHIDRERFQMDFLVGTDEPAHYDDEIRALGCRLIRAARPNPRRPARSAREFLNVLRTEGPYDIVHGHEQELSGYYLRYAANFSIPLRIAHSHNDATRLPGYRAGLGNRVRASMMRRWIIRYATHGLACSRIAAPVTFGPRWERDPRWQILPYGIDLEPFRQPVERDAVRAEFGIVPHEFVIGHVGRFESQKNHAFLIDVVRELAARGQPFKLLLVGDGPLRPMIEEQVRSRGLTDHVVFAGVRPDVPRVMLAAMDVLVFPSHFEGLPLVLLEAQAAGLPCVASDTISTEVMVHRPLFQMVSLSRPPAEWAGAVERARSVRSDQSAALQCLTTNGFDIRANVRRLENLYADAWQHRD